MVSKNTQDIVDNCSESSSFSSYPSSSDSNSSSKSPPPAPYGTMSRTRPNILITGTPKTGKTTTSELVAIANDMEHINVGDIVKEKHCYTGRDEEFDAFLLDEDKVSLLLLLFIF